MVRRLDIAVMILGPRIAARRDGHLSGRMAGKTGGSQCYSETLLRVDRGMRARARDQIGATSFEHRLPGDHTRKLEVDHSVLRWYVNLACAREMTVCVLDDLRVGIDR